MFIPTSSLVLWTMLYQNSKLQKNYESTFPWKLLQFFVLYFDMLEADKQKSKQELILALKKNFKGHIISNYNPGKN